MLAPLVGYLIGSLLAWAAYGSDTDRPTVQSQGFLMAALLGVGLYGPVNAYFLAFYPDWTFGYQLAPGEKTLAFSMGLVLLDAASIPGSTWLSGWFSRHERSRQGAVKLALPAVLVAIVMFFVSLPRLGVSTTLAGFEGNFGVRPVAGTDLGYALLWMGLVLAAAIAWTVRVLQSEQ